MDVLENKLNYRIRHKNKIRDILQNCVSSLQLTPSCVIVTISARVPGATELNFHGSQSAAAIVVACVFETKRTLYLGI